MVDMQHITSALISARRETMRALVWSIRFVAPSPRDNLCFLFVFFCIVSDTNHVPIHFFCHLSFLFLEGGGLTGQSCRHLLVRVYLSVSLTSVSWKATSLWCSLVGLRGGRGACEMNLQSIFIMGNHKQ